MPKPFRALILALMLLALPWNTRAQDSLEASLSTPDTGSFPQIRAYLSVRDGEGRFLSGLTAHEVSVIENGVEIAPLSLEEQSPGAQIAVAIDPSPAFAVRDTNGATRYDHVVEALNAWADSRAGTPSDNLSLFVTAGAGEARLEGYTAFKEALAAAPSDHRNAVTNLQTLATAIDIVSDPTPRPGMGRAVLFITPEANFDTIPALSDMAMRAGQSGVRIYVWMVTSEAFFETRGAAELQAMAEATGGSMFAFSGTGTLPDPEFYFDALRRTYLLEYSSGVRASGEVELSAAVRTSSGEVLAPPLTLSLTVLPPNPFFVSPPDEIYRSLVPDADGNLSAGRRVPNDQSIEILVEFPDGYPRELVRTTLYVNGRIADENTSPPFDAFEWDLREVVESGRFTLQVEAVDDLGLSSISLETLVNITVQRMPEGIVPTISRNSPLVVTVVVLLAGGILIAVLLRVRGLRPAPQQGNGKRANKRKRTPILQATDSSPRPAAKTPFTRWANRLNWPQRSAPQTEAIAFLERIDGAENGAPSHAVHINEVTIGTDPSQATIVLRESSVAGLHARLHRNEHREFYVSDFGSIAGTYINYLPANGDPMRIEHGDIVHFGMAGFRFRLNPPPQTPPPSVRLEEDEP